MSEICFCIPARYKSTRLHNKLLLKFGDETCIVKTVKQVLKSKYANKDNVYILTDNTLIQEELTGLECNVIMTSENYCNGTERISKNLDLVPEKYSIIVNVQADEPFISPLNIDESISKHLQNTGDIFYTTLHEENNAIDYLKSTASLKLVTDIHNNVLYYSRNIIPWNKKNEIKEGYTYKTFTGIYVFNRHYLAIYCKIKNTELQDEEDCEQLKIIENGFTIKTYPTIDYNEISLNTNEDYEYLFNKYSN